MRLFGFIGGLRLWCSLTGQLLSSSETLDLRVPGIKAPIHLRRRDLPIFWQIMVMRENDFEKLPQAARVRDALQGLLSEGLKPVIVDCGGHIGLSSVWFASRFPQTTVYVIEPDAANFKLLTRNASAYTNIVPLNGGIWNRSCDLAIENPDSGSASFRLQEVGDGAGAARPGLLRAYTIDEVFRREADNRLFLVKIDIEGAESEVFKHSADWLDDAAAVIIELHDWLLPGQGTSKNFFKRISEHNLDVVLQGENLLLFKSPVPAAVPAYEEQVSA